MSVSTKILVTGASGFTGSALCAALAGRGHDVHGLSLRRLGGLIYPVHMGDILNRQSLQRVLHAIRPQQIVHLAARAFVGSDDHLGFYQANVIGTCNLLDTARESGVERVIVASSANVYGVPASVEPLSEGSPTAPVSHYAASKLAMEHMVRTYREDFGLVITRPFNYTGPGQDVSYLIPKLVRHFRDRAPSIQLGNLDVARDFTSLDDVVRAYISILESELCDDTLNVCSGVAVSLHSLLQKLADMSGHHPVIASTAGLSRRNEISVLCGDNRRLCGLTGWEPVQGIDDILRNMLDAD